MRRINRSPVHFSHKGQWRGALVFSLVCAWINEWVNNGDAGDLRRHRAHHDVSVMILQCTSWLSDNGRYLTMSITAVSKIRPFHRLYFVVTLCHENLFNLLRYWISRIARLCYAYLSLTTTIVLQTWLSLHGNYAPISVLQLVYGQIVWTHKWQRCVLGLFVIQ